MDVWDLWYLQPSAGCSGFATVLFSASQLCKVVHKKPLFPCVPFQMLIFLVLANVEVKVPYYYDSQTNFAYFVYDKFPLYSGKIFRKYVPPLTTSFSLGIHLFLSKFVLALPTLQKLSIFMSRHLSSLPFFSRHPGNLATFSFSVDSHKKL